MAIGRFFMRKKKAEEGKPKKAKKNKKRKAFKLMRKAPRKQAKKRAARKAARRGAPTKPIEVSRDECPECGSSHIIISKMTGNTICQDCGAIFAGLAPDVARKFEEVKHQG